MGTYSKGPYTRVGFVEDLKLEVCGSMLVAKPVN